MPNIFLDLLDRSGILKQLEQQGQIYNTPQGQQEAINKGLGMATMMAPTAPINKGILSASDKSYKVLNWDDLDNVIDILTGKTASATEDKIAAMNLVRKEAGQQLLPEELTKYANDLNKIVNLIQKRIRPQGDY